MDRTGDRSWYDALFHRHEIGHVSRTGATEQLSRSRLVAVWVTGCSPANRRPWAVGRGLPPGSAHDSDRLSGRKAAHGRPACDRPGPQTAGQNRGRGGGIRTHDLVLPKHVRCRCATPRRIQAWISHVTRQSSLRVRRHTGPRNEKPSHPPPSPLRSHVPRISHVLGNGRRPVDRFARWATHPRRHPATERALRHPRAVLPPSSEQALPSLRPAPGP
jgi:hypothetical protein